MPGRNPLQGRNPPAGCNHYLLLQTLGRLQIRWPQAMPGMMRDQ